jgi:hypothetical protein
MVGRWAEVRNHFGKTSVVYTIRSKDGELIVSGIDEHGRVELKITNISWDGELLSFATLYPPTKHKTEHEFRLAANGRAQLRVSYSDEYGRHEADEIWKKVTR